MATRRMLSVSISVSEQVAALRDDFTRLLFTWMIAHADDYGVLPGSAAKLKALVIPMLDHTPTAVEAALADMESNELIWRYHGADGRPWIQFRKWEEHQQGLHKRTAPKSPRYADSGGYTKESPGTSGNVREVPASRARAEQNRIGKGREDHRRDASASARVDPLFDALFAEFYEPGAILTDAARGPLNRALKDIRTHGGTPEQVPIRGAEYKARMPHVAYTPSALAKHWPTLGHKGQRPTQKPPQPGEARGFRSADSSSITARPAALKEA